MDDQSTKSVYKIKGILKFQGVEFLQSVDAATKDATKRFDKSISVKIKENVKSIASTEEKINESENRQADIVERQRNFIERTETGVKPVTKMFSGLFDRAIKKPMDVLQKLILGLLIKNIPAIINAAKEVFRKCRLIIYQVRELGALVGNLFENSYQIINAAIQNIINFDFTDSEKRLNTAVENFEKDYKNDMKDLEALSKSWNLQSDELDSVLDRLDKGEDPRKAVQPLDTITGRPNSGGATVSGTAEEYRIAAAIATEAGRGVSATDVLQVAANRVADDRYPDNFTDVFAQPGQFQGVFDRGIDNYRNVSSAEDAAAFSGRSIEQIQGYVSDLRNTDFRSDSAKEIGGALEFRAAPSYYQQRPNERPSGTGSDGRIPGSSWRGGAGDNQILRDPSKDPMRSGGAAPITYTQGSKGTRPSSSSTFNGSVSNTQVVDELDVVNDKSPLGGVTPGQGFGASRGGGTRSHQGLDIGTYGSRGFKVALRASGFVARVGNDRNGYGKFVIIEVPSMGKSFMFAHLANTTVKQGDAYAGGAIGEIGDTGNSPGSIHLHFEVYQGGANGKAIDPAPYLGLLSIGRSVRSSQEIASKLNIDDIGMMKASDARIDSLYYDHETAEATNSIVMVHHPIVATQKTVVNNRIPSSGGKISIGGSKRASQNYNDVLMKSLA